MKTQWGPLFAAVGAALIVLGTIWLTRAASVSFTTRLAVRAMAILTIAIGIAISAYGLLGLLLVGVL